MMAPVAVLALIGMSTQFEGAAAGQQAEHPPDVGAQGQDFLDRGQEQTQDRTDGEVLRLPIPGVGTEPLHAQSALEKSPPSRGTGPTGHGASPQILEAACPQRGASVLF